MEKVWTVYILECGDGTLYTGITDDLERRLRAHTEGRGAKYTRGRGPLKLRYLEAVADKRTALKRECALKRLRRKEKIALICEKEQETQAWLAFRGTQVYNETEKQRAQSLPREE